MEKSVLTDVSLTVIEIWKTIEINRSYEVSSYGRIRSLAKNEIKILTPRVHTRGYLRISMRFENKKKDFYIHRLVCTAFMGDPVDGRNQVNHINGIKSDNRITNLEWCSAKENRIHAESLENVILGHKNQGQALKATWSKKLQKN